MAKTKKKKDEWLVLVGAHLKRLREQRGLTQGQLAEALGVSVGTVCYRERNGSLPIDELPRYAKVLGIPQDKVLPK